MFQLDRHLKLITIDQTYMKALYETCNQVFFLPSAYSNKPYLGLLINHDGRKYAIPLTSAKEKHKSWRNHHKMFRKKMIIPKTVPEKEMMNKKSSQ